MRLVVLANYCNASSECGRMVGRGAVDASVSRFSQAVVPLSLSLGILAPVPGASKAPEGLRPPPLPRDRL